MEHGARFTGLEARIDDLSERLDRHSEQAQARFEQIDARFEQIDARFAQVDVRLGDMEAQFRNVLEHVSAEGERTRRYFDVVVEQVRAERNLVIDATHALDSRLSSLETTNASDHAQFDRRLSTLEARRKPGRR
jgi:chromosome segregation ATPase